VLRGKPAELHRIYPAIADATPYATERTGDATGELRARLEAEQAKVGILEDVVRDLRQRLDAEAEERRRLTAILADQRTIHPTGSTVEPVPSPARRRWWRWRG
jgi:hypothetical protein